MSQPSDHVATDDIAKMIHDLDATFVLYSFQLVRRTFYKQMLDQDESSLSREGLIFFHRNYFHPSDEVGEEVDWLTEGF